MSEINPLMPQAAVQERVHKQLKWFKIRADVSMFLYRTIITAIICLSASLPFLASIDSGTVRTWWIPIISLLIVALTGLNAAWSFHKTWHSYRTAENQLRHAIAVWEHELQNATVVDEKNREKNTYDATKALLARWFDISTSETENFFDVIDRGGTK